MLTLALGGPLVGDVLSTVAQCRAGSRCAAWLIVAVAVAVAVVVVVAIVVPVVVVFWAPVVSSKTAIRAAFWSLVPVVAAVLVVVGRTQRMGDLQMEAWHGGD